MPVTIREADRTVAAVAAANGGRYDIDAHLRHDPTASDAFAQTHVRRLEAMRRLTGAVERAADGSWIIAEDHLDRAAAYEAARAKETPVRVELLSAQPLETLAAPIDYGFYIERQLQPVADAILAFMGSDFDTVMSGQARLF